MKRVSRHYKLVLLIFLAFTAAQIQPETILVDAQIGESFSEILTITNTLARPAEYTLRLHPFSEYLSQAVSLQEETLFLRPQESKNFQISATVPSLGPETHKLTYELVEDQRVVANSTIHIPVAGTPNLEASLTASTETIREGQTLPVHIELTNFGNIIAYYRVRVQILQASEQIGSVTYPQQLQVLPGAQEKIILPYTDKLPPEEYVLVVEATVNEQQELSVQEPFIVSKHQEAIRVRAGDVLRVDVAEQQRPVQIEYVLRQTNRVVRQETLLVQQEQLDISTSTLPTGVYELTVQSPQDTQVILIEVYASRSVWSWLVILFVLAMGALLLFLTHLRANIRLFWLSYKISRREKRLNTLITRAHELERRYGS